MDFGKLASIAALALALSLAAQAEDTAQEASGETGQEAAAAAAPATEEAAARSGIELGPPGRDAQGRPGRIHVVAKGDTLWDISDACLGTPWVWPSVWQDNGEIDNPHRIYPGNRIWITPHEMRLVSAEEAEALLNGDVPAAMGDMDAAPEFDQPRPTYRFSEVQTAGFVTREQFDGSFSIVDSSIDRTWFGDHDLVIIGRGEGEVAEGDRFSIFRRGERVGHPDSGVLLGYATEELGWLEVTAVHDETSEAMIRLSRSEIRRGDHLLPLEVHPSEIEVLSKPDVDGRIVFTPSRRFEMGSNDVVYLNRGERDGLSVGSPLEVFRPLGEEKDQVRGETLALPDHIVAKLLVVTVREDSAVAVVTHTTAELSRGDQFRGTEDLTW